MPDSRNNENACAAPAAVPVGARTPGATRLCTAVAQAASLNASFQPIAKLYSATERAPSQGCRREDLLSVCAQSATDDGTATYDAT
jgi:hypothetical protein